MDETSPYALSPVSTADLNPAPAIAIGAPANAGSPNPASSPLCVAMALVHSIFGNGWLLPLETIDRRPSLVCQIGTEKAAGATHEPGPQLRPSGGAPSPHAILRRRDFCFREVHRLSARVQPLRNAYGKSCRKAPLLHLIADPPLGNRFGRGHLASPDLGLRDIPGLWLTAQCRATCRRERVVRSQRASQKLLLLGIGLVERARGTRVDVALAAAPLQHLLIRALFDFDVLLLGLGLGTLPDAAHVAVRIVDRLEAHLLEHERLEQQLHPVRFILPTLLLCHFRSDARRDLATRLIRHPVALYADADERHRSGPVMPCPVARVPRASDPMPAHSVHADHSFHSIR